MNAIRLRSAGCGAAWTRVEVPGPASRRWLRHAANRVTAAIAEWRRRSFSRAMLTSFDERMLRDIGITRVDAWREINKPFWRR